MLSFMRIPKIAAIAILVFSSVAANNVAPSKSELESMYDKAFRAFDANNFPEALKELDAIDARQPDLAESQNLRGVIFMRQGIYDKAEAALYRAIELDPKFWNARFNLAEIPFLQKNWTEARNRFQALLSSNSAELQGEATQLIQYKILLTYVLEGKDNMVDSFISKFELSTDTPAVQYGNAAIAFQHKDEKAAKDWIAAAGKNFSPQLNKLFAESLYEVGWLEKPVGQSRAALELTSAAERTARTKAYAKGKFDQAEEAFQKRDLPGALKLLDEAEAAEPNQPAHLNLRGEILMEQKDFDQAESFFKKALKADPKFREAQYNLAQIPFKKKEYSKARDRLEALFAATPGGDKNQAAQLIKFKIFMTLLLEDKDSRAQKLMEQFQFTGDTPALYYAQAAWEFKHNNPTKANDWINSARKIYSLALNIVFADSFYDAGWLQNPASTEQPASSRAAVAQTEAAAPTGSNPVIEPSPIPGAAENQAAKEAGTNVAPSTSPVISGMEATTFSGTAASAGSSPVQSITAQNASDTTSIAPSASISSAAASPPASKPESAVRASKPQPPAGSVASASPAAVVPPRVAAASTPATILAPARVREWSRPTIGERLYRITDWHTVLVVGLLLAGIILLAWVVIPELRRRTVTSFYRPVAPMTEPRFDEMDSLAVNEEMASRNRLTGGPPQRSVQLKASEPSVRRAVIPVGKPGRGQAEPDVSGPDDVLSSAAPEPAAAPFEEEAIEEFAPAIPEAETSNVVEPVTMAGDTEVPFAVEETVSLTEQMIQSSANIPVEPDVEPAMTESSAIAESELEPVGQGQPIPYQTPATTIESSMAEITKPEPESPTVRPMELSPADAAIAGVGAVRHSIESPSFAPQVVSTEPSVQQSTTPATMPEPTQTPPVIRTATTGAPAPSPGATQTAVQLTFSCEIASLQLTPAFKMGALQLKPISKIVMMRLSPSQHPQPAMNLQVTFEIATIQPAGGSLGTVRLTPSQQQKPGVITSPAFTIAGVQLVSNFESAPVQLTPSQQGKASVHVTASFQIATVEFSPSFEIASIVLNSTSKNVSVQLPGAGPSSIEGAPVFEIGNVQLGGNGELGLIQLTPPGSGAKRG
jgi:predicted Zn-dependent protease